MVTRSAVICSAPDCSIVTVVAVTSPASLRISSIASEGLLYAVSLETTIGGSDPLERGLCSSAVISLIVQTHSRVGGSFRATLVTNECTKGGLIIVFQDPVQHQGAAV